MKILALSLTLLASCLAGAQEFPRYELAGGYSYGTYDNLTVSNRLSPQGWNGSFATNLMRWVGFEVDGGGQYLNQSQVVVVQGLTYTMQNPAFYSFQAGPRFAYRRERITTFAHSLFGVHRALSYSQATFPTPGTIFVPYENAFGTALGGGLDFNISRRFALRTQGDYLITRPGASAATGNQNRFRAVAGIVFTFGETQRQSARNNTPALVPLASAVAAPHTEASAKPALSPVAPTASPAWLNATPAAPSSAAPRPTPAPAAVATAAKAAPAPQQTAQRVTPVAPSPKPQAYISSPPPPGQEESLGEAARRYRALKKQQQQSQ